MGGKDMGESLVPSVDSKTMTCVILFGEVLVPIDHLFVSINSTYMGVVRNATNVSADRAA